MESIFFCKTRTDYAYRLRVQEFVTGKNLSFNQSSKQESLSFFFSRESYFIKAIENVFPVFAYPNINTRGVGEFSTVTQTRDEVEGLHNRADKGWAVKRARPSKKV